MSNPYVREDMIRPMGVNNLNQLVERQLGGAPYEVVRCIHNNIQWLNHIHQNMSMLQEVGNNVHLVSGLNMYMGEITRVSQNLQDIVNMNDTLPAIRELAPRINAFTSQLTILNGESKANIKNAETLLQEVSQLQNEVKSLTIGYEETLAKLIQDAHSKMGEYVYSYQEELKKYLEEVKQMHLEISQVLPNILKIGESGLDIYNTVMHLIASDAVTTALFSKKEEDIAFALEKIKHSESVGNKEGQLRERLSYNRESNNMLNLIKDPDVINNGDCSC